MGPILFLLLINVLPEDITNELFSKFNNVDNITSLVACYADDISHVLSHKSLYAITEICNSAIDIVVKLVNEKSLILNQSKTNFLYFNSIHNRFAHQEPILRISNTNLESPDVVSFLGLKINKHLDWQNEVDFLSTKIRKGIYALGRLRDEVSLPVLRTVYFSHVYCHIKNNIIFWGHCSAANRIFILQKFAIRTIFRVPKRTSCVNLFTELGILTVPGIYIYESCMFVKNNLNLFEINQDVHSYNTRNRNKLRVIQHSKSFMEKGPKYRLIHIYNKLPSEVKNLQNINMFKKRLFALLLESNLYKIQEYFEM